MEAEKGNLRERLAWNTLRDAGVNGLEKGTKHPSPGLFADGENQKGRIVGSVAAAEFGDGIDYFLLYRARGERPVLFK